MNITSMIIITETDIMFAIELKVKLYNYGYRVNQIFSDSDAAVEYSSRHFPDIVLIEAEKAAETAMIDTGMKLKELNPAVQIIFITGTSDPDFLKKAQQAAPYAVLSKPLGNKQLLYAINSAACEKNEAAPTGSPVEIMEQKTNSFTS